MNITKITVIVSLFMAISLASAYTAEQQNLLDGTRLSFLLGQEYQKVTVQGGSVIAYNNLADQWNAWVQNNFGQDSSLFVKKMTEPVDLGKPFLYSNNTTNKGITHAIDSRASYRTNDINLLPDWAIAKYAAGEQGQTYGEGYLGGV